RGRHQKRPRDAGATGRTKLGNMERITRGIPICVVVAFLLLGVGACTSHYAPKPRGFFRIELPEKAYHPLSSSCPFVFAMPVYATMGPDRSTDALPCWADILFDQFNARIHLSYFQIDDTSHFNELVEDARTFAFKHTIKA